MMDAMGLEDAEEGEVLSFPPFFLFFIALKKGTTQFGTVASFVKVQNDKAC